MGNSKNGINGKILLKKLSDCQTSDDIFNVLHEAMDIKTLQDRVKNLSENPLVIALYEQRIKMNIQFYPNNYTTHQDAVTLAAAKYLEINKNKKSVKDFRMEAVRQKEKREQELRKKEGPSSSILFSRGMQGR